MYGDAINESGNKMNEKQCAGESDGKKATNTVEWGDSWEKIVGVFGCKLVVLR